MSKSDRAQSSNDTVSATLPTKGGLLRWTYVVPRAILAGLVWAFFTYGFDPLLRFGVISAGQRAARAKVDIAGLETTFFSPTLKAANIAIANRKRPGTNLVEFADLRGKLELPALLKRSFIVNEASVSGLRWDTKRADSGLLPGEEPDLSEEPDSQMLEKVKQEFLTRGQDWLAGLLDRAKLEFDPDQFQTVRLGQELEERWPKEFSNYEAEINALKQRIDELHDSLKIKGGNELQKLDRYTKAGKEVEQVLREIEELRARLGQTMRQAQDDLQALNEAKSHDLQKIKEKADIMNLDPNQVAEFLLGPELTHRLETAIGWTKFLRERVRLATDTPKPERMRGEDIVFQRPQELPLFLIRLLNVDGQGDFGGEDIAFKGTISGITSNPKIHGKPIIVRIDGSGALPESASVVRTPTSEQSSQKTLTGTNDRIVASGLLGVQLKAVLDYTQDVPVHELLLSYKEPRPSQQELGKSDSVQLTAQSRGVDCLADLKLVGDDLTGRIDYQQAIDSISAELGGKRFKGDEQVLAVVRDVVSNIRKVDAQMTLTGTVLKPQFKIRSSLGHDLSTGINTAFARQLEAGRLKLLAHFDAQTAKQSAKLTELYDEQLQKLTGKLQLNKSELTEIAQSFGLKLPSGVDLKKVAGGLPIDLTKPLDPNKPVDLKSLGKSLPKLNDKLPPLPTMPDLKNATLPKFDERPEALPLPGLSNKKSNQPTGVIQQASEMEHTLEELGLFGKKKTSKKSSPKVKPASGEQPAEKTPATTADSTGSPESK